MPQNGLQSVQTVLGVPNKPYPIKFEPLQPPESLLEVASKSPKIPLFECYFGF